MGKLERLDDRQTWNNMSTPKLIERILTLYNTKKWHDCVFKLFKSDGSEEFVFAHRVILASSSPVFEALCFGAMAEQNPISITDVDPDAFQKMIKFIYTDAVEFANAEDACNVLYIAKKYLIYTLAGQAIAYISDEIDEMNCLQIHEFAKFVYEERLIKESWSYICSHLDVIVKNLTYDYLSSDIIKRLVDEESLNGGELTLFKMCMLWAEAECKQRNLKVTGSNLRNILLENDVLNKIRLLSLNENEFEIGPLESNILNCDEIEYIRKQVSELKIMMVKSCDTAEIERKMTETNKYPLSVCNTFQPRNIIPLKKVYCHRFIEEQFKVLSFLIPSYVTVITVNKSVRLTGIFFSGKSYNPYYKRIYTENIDVTISHSNSKLVQTSFSNDVLYNSVFKVPVDPPLILERCKEYMFSITLGNYTGYTIGRRNSVCKLPSGLCVTFEERTNAQFGDPSFCVYETRISFISGLELSI